MGVAVQHVQADKKTGRLIYRRGVPAALRPFFPGNRSEFIRSLKSRVPNAQAIALRDAFAAEFERLTAFAKKAASGAFDRLDEATIAYLAESFVHASLEADEAARWCPEEKGLHANIAVNLEGAGIAFQSAFEGQERKRFAVKARETLEGMLPLYRAYRADGDVTGIVDLWTDEALLLAEAKGLRLHPEGPEFALLCRSLNDAAIRAGEMKLARLDGGTVETPPEPLRPVSVPSSIASAQKSGQSFEAIAEGMMSTTALEITPTTKDAWRSALRFLREMHGTLRPAEFTRTRATALRDALFHRPAKLPKDERNTPLPEIVERYRETKGVRRLSGRTVKKHLVSLSTIWNSAQEEGWIPTSLANPFKGVRVSEEAPPENPQELSEDEIAAMFGTPVFSQGERPQGGRGHASFWIPLLLRHTGARPEEIAQLLLSDVTEAEDGRLLLKITSDGEEHPAKGKRSLKTRKTRTGIRQFPVPQELMRLGFGRYVKWLRDGSEAALFPKLTTKGSRGLYASFSRWWSGYLRKHDAFPTGDGRRALREFRQNWASAAIRSGLSLEERKYLMGHAIDPQTASGRYGNRIAIGEAMSRVRFEGPDLSAVTPWREP